MAAAAEAVADGAAPRALRDRRNSNPNIVSDDLDALLGPEKPVQSKKSKKKSKSNRDDDWHDGIPSDTKDKKAENKFGLACRFQLPPLKMPAYRMNEVPLPSKTLDDSVSKPAPLAAPQHAALPSGDGDRSSLHVTDPTASRAFGDRADGLWQPQVVLVNPDRPAWLDVMGEILLLCNEVGLVG